MASHAEKPVTFGATIQGATAPQTLPQPALRSPPSADSNLSAAVAEKDPAMDSSNPYSAFYKHPDARRSLDGPADQSKTHLAVSTHDLEAGLPLSAATTQAPKVSVDGRVKECTMWPSRQEMLAKKKMNRRAKRCNLFRNLNSKQRLWAKIIIALIVVGLAVGLGVGISRAVGGGVWSSHGQKTIDHN